MEQLQKHHNKSSLNEFLSSLSESENISPAMTMAQVRAIESHPLSALVDRSQPKPDRTDCHTFLSALCTQLTAYFGEAWSDAQLMDSVKILYENYYYLRSADWVYFAKKAKSLHFGKVYGKFSPATLMEWSEKFAYDWKQESINLTISAANASKSIENDSRVNREILKGLERAKNAFALHAYKDGQF